MAGLVGDVQAFTSGKVRAAIINLKNQNKVERKMEMKGSQPEI